MTGELFEWDDEKEAVNLRNHGVSFHDAVVALRDPFAFEVIDNREIYREERINLIGMCGDRLLHVTYTERGDRLRIISARRAEKYEREDYCRENSV
jgi:uncharacterized DUF497 family protein